MYLYADNMRPLSSPKSRFGRMVCVIIVLKVAQFHIVGEAERAKNVLARTVGEGKHPSP